MTLEINRSDSLLYNSRLADECFPRSNHLENTPLVPMVNHKGKEGAAITALEYFTQAGCPQAFIETLLNEAGEWKLKPIEDVNPYELSIEELDQLMLKITEPIYGLANNSLDHIYDSGFNRHDITHIKKVVAATRRLLIDAGATQEEQAVATLAAWGHDKGNPLGRIFHSLISPNMMSKQLPMVKSNMEKWRWVRRAMQLHNEPVAANVIAAEEKYLGRKFSEDEIIEFMRKKFGKVALALIIGDKTDLGGHRISIKPNGDAVHTDRYLEVNLLGRTTEKTGLSEDNTSFVWDLKFTVGDVPTDPDDSEPSRERFMRAAANREDGVRAMVSEAVHDAFRSMGYSYMDSWCKNFWDLYYERIIFTARAAFALYPSIDSFKIKVTDQDGLEERQMTFRRDRLENDFALFTKKANKHKPKKPAVTK